MSLIRVFGVEIARMSALDFGLLIILALVFFRLFFW